MKGFIRILSLLLVLVVLLVAAALVQGQEEVVLSEGCQLMASGGFNLQFPPPSPVKVCADCTHTFFDGEDIIITVDDLDGDPSTAYTADITFKGLRTTAGGEFTYSISGSVNQQSPLSLVIVDVLGGEYLAPSASAGAPHLSLQLTATCGINITPTYRQQCEDWAAFGFRNRGECVRSVGGQG